MTIVYAGITHAQIWFIFTFNRESRRWHYHRKETERKLPALELDVGAAKTWLRSAYAEKRLVARVMPCEPVQVKH